MAKQKKQSNLKVELVTLADQVIQSKEGKLSIIGLFDQFFLSHMPLNWPKMFMVAVLKGEPKKTHEVSVKMFDPNDKEIFSKKGKLVLGENGKTNLLIELVGFLLSHEGVYKIKVYSNGEEIGTFNFSVTYIKGGSSAAKKKSPTFPN